MPDTQARKTASSPRKFSADETPASSEEPPYGPGKATAFLLLEDGARLEGIGLGAPGVTAPAELCFCTAMTGYQEVLTDPSYSGQIVTFTFPHIGNVGTNEDDAENAEMLALGMVCKELPTNPSSWRSIAHLSHWLKERGRIGIAGVDTRQITRLLRIRGPQKALIAFPKTEADQPDVPSLIKALNDWPGLEGLELAKTAAGPARDWIKGAWKPTPSRSSSTKQSAGKSGKAKTVVALDFGAKDNILRSLKETGCVVRVLPGNASLKEILACKPDGIFLSNGPGDPRATAQYATPVLQALMQRKIPIFGICLGHQLLAHAIGADTYKLDQGHRGANQPVRENVSGQVLITSQNHGFAVDAKTLPKGAIATHTSLFDGSNEGLSIPEANVFSVQFHPEASPGPHDAFHLFDRFVSVMNGQSLSKIYHAQTH